MKPSAPVTNILTLRSLPLRASQVSFEWQEMCLFGLALLQFGAARMTEATVGQLLPMRIIQLGVAPPYSPVPLNPQQSRRNPAQQFRLSRSDSPFSAFAPN